MTIRTYKPRRGRLTPRQRAAIEIDDGLLLRTGEVGDAIAAWAGPVVLEIGFGTGSATAIMAAADPATLIVAVDVHTPGVGGLLHRVREQGLANVRVVEGDALVLLREDIVQEAGALGPLAGVRSFFPDPWPKARHHKRRLVTAPHARLIAAAVRPGGWWHLATDWASYADAMVEEVEASGAWIGGVIARPAERAVTRYEEFALADGRPITDLRFTRR